MGGLLYQSIICFLQIIASCLEKAIEDGAERVYSLISTYEKASCQKVNYEKSLIYFGSSVSKINKSTVASILGVRVSKNPEKYLGLPMMIGRSKTQAFTHYADRFKSRIESWNLRFLSIEGKETMIKSVVQALPIYAMQCFLFPKSLCSQLENVLNRFWWRTTSTLKGVH